MIVVYLIEGGGEEREKEGKGEREIAGREKSERVRSFPSSRRGTPARCPSSVR